jgi:DNA-binding LytR/AlgR family response regulator
VCSAGTGAEALAVLERDTDIGLLFTDILMPGGINGFELAAEVRRRRPGLAILMTSGFPGNFSSGKPDDFEIIRKPFTRSELSAAFLQVLSSH